MGAFDRHKDLFLVSHGGISASTTNMTNMLGYVTGNCWGILSSSHTRILQSICAIHDTGHKRGGEMVRGEKCQRLGVKKEHIRETQVTHVQNYVNYEQHKQWRKLHGRKGKSGRGSSN